MQIGGEGRMCLLQLSVGVHQPCPPLQEQGIPVTPHYVHHFPL